MPLLLHRSPEPKQEPKAGKGAPESHPLRPQMKINLSNQWPAASLAFIQTSIMLLDQ